MICLQVRAIQYVCPLVCVRCEKASLKLLCLAMSYLVLHSSLFFNPTSLSLSFISFCMILFNYYFFSVMMLYDIDALCSSFLSVKQAFSPQGTPLSLTTSPIGAQKLKSVEDNVKEVVEEGNDEKRKEVSSIDKNIEESCDEIVTVPILTPVQIPVPVSVPLLAPVPIRIPATVPVPVSGPVNVDFLHCFAVKSCPLSYVLYRAIEQGLGLECASIMEVSTK